MNGYEACERICEIYKIFNKMHSTFSDKQNCKDAIN